MIVRGHDDQRIRREREGLDVELIGRCFAKDVQVVLVGVDTIDDAVSVGNLECHVDA